MSFWDDYTHIRPYSITSLVDLLRANGLVSKRIYHSDHGRIQLDILTSYRLSGLIFGRLLGGKEIEGTFVKARAAR